jgi:hypothetical protein
MANPRGRRFERGSGCFTCESCGRKTRKTGVTSGSDWPVCPDCYELAGYQNGVSDNGPLDAAEYLTLARNHARAIYAKGGSFDWKDAFWAECGDRAQDELHELALALRAAEDNRVAVVLHVEP